jgi:hypothetical protein
MTDGAMRSWSWLMVHRRNRALDETTAKHTRLAFSGIIKHARLPRRYAMFAVHQFDLATRGAVSAARLPGGDVSNGL